MTGTGVEDMGERLPSWLPKSPTGIEGFDQITDGGLPTGRPTLVCGPPGAGKSLFAVQFLVNGATRYAEPGVFLTFEEKCLDLVANVGSLGFDLDGLGRDGQLMLDALPLRAGARATGRVNRAAWKGGVACGRCYGNVVAGQGGDEGDFAGRVAAGSGVGEADAERAENGRLVRDHVRCACGGRQKALSNLRREHGPRAAGGPCVLTPQGGCGGWGG